MTQVRIYKENVIKIFSRHLRSEVSYRIPLPHVPQQSHRFKAEAINSNAVEVAAKYRRRFVEDAFQKYFNRLGCHLERVVVRHVVNVVSRVDNEQVWRLERLHDDGVRQVWVADPTELELVVVLRPLGSDDLLDHVSELQLVRHKLVQFVLLDHGQHQELAGLLQLVDVLASYLREGQELFLADPLVQRGVQMLRFNDLMAVGQWERVVRVLLVDYDDWSGVDEEMLVGHLHIGRVEISERLIDLRGNVVRAPEVTRLLADVDEENRVVGL